MQNDFLPGGSLGVPGGDEIVPLINRYLSLFRLRELPVYLTRDWHPPEHRSFRNQGGLWPPHCVAGTDGAAFAPGLELGGGEVVISKADTVSQDAYSAFEGTDLDLRLRYQQVKRLYVAGLATDYCVLNTVLDALRAGFPTVVLGDAIRAVDVNPGDGERAVEEMKKGGALFADYAGAAAGS